MSLAILARSSSGDDDELVFVDKPSGVLVHNSAWAGPREHTLVDDVKDALGPGLHPLHRLDRQTSGVVAFARAPGAWTLGDKVYRALVRGHVREPVDIDHAIVDDEDGIARDAQSRVRPIACSPAERCSLVEITLLTGRRHQARRHLKHISHPVLGDASYGKGPLNRDYRARYGLARLALHACSLRVTSVDGARSFDATAPWPADLAAVCAKLFRDDAR